MSDQLKADLLRGQPHQSHAYQGEHETDHPIMTEAISTVMPFVSPTLIRIDQLRHHPLNRRVEGLDDEHVKDIASSIEASGFIQTKALTVREIDGGYEVIEGHHRLEAGRQAGLAEIPVYVEQLTDDEALIKLINGNRQRGNNPLDIGLAALHLSKGKGGAGQKGGQAEYARQLGVSAQVLGENIKAATVHEKLSARADGSELSARADSFIGLHRHLYEISKCPEKYWSHLAQALITEALSVNVIKARCERIKTLEKARPAWLQIPAGMTGELCSGSKTAQSLTTTFARADEVHETLNVITLYRHIDSGETRTESGREYHVMLPESFEYDARSAFAQTLDGLELTNTGVNDSERFVLKYIAEHSDSQERLDPVLSESEQEAIEQQRAAQLKTEYREHYTPRMHEGECVEILRTLEDNTVDLAVIDPPYNMDKADWDSFGSGRDFADWCATWLTEVQRILKPSGSVYVFGINRMLSHVQHRMDDMGLRYRSWIIWDTIQGAGNNMWPNRYEGILYYSKSNETYENTDAVKLLRHEENIREYKGKTYEFKSPSNVWRFPCVDDKSADRTEHPTQKPVELIERIIKGSSPEGGLVLDCFMGSGTTGVAAMLNKRRCIGIEQNPDYVKLAQSRFDVTEVPE